MTTFSFFMVSLPVQVLGHCCMQGQHLTLGQIVTVCVMSDDGSQYCEVATPAPSGRLLGASHGLDRPVTVCRLHALQPDLGPKGGCHLAVTQHCSRMQHLCRADS